MNIEADIIELIAPTQPQLSRLVEDFKQGVKTISCKTLRMEVRQGAQPRTRITKKRSTTRIT
jgi:hypothetical protein